MVAKKKAKKSRSRKPTPKAVKKAAVASPAPEALEYCRALIQADGTLFLEYKWSHLPGAGSQEHSEDVSGWHDEEIIDLVKALVDIERPADVVKIEILR